jgi:carbonic anhydrase
MIARLCLIAVSVLSFTGILVGSGPDPAAPPLTARQALGLLKAGNDRFASNASRPISLSENRRKELVADQHPVAMVLSCADSRVPPEHIFNVGLGELFVIRTAGEVVDRSILATAEYGAEHLHIPLLVVMGHESCGAVRAAADAKAPAESANMEYLLKAIQAARQPSPNAHQAQEDRNEIKGLILANVAQAINDIMAKSPALRHEVNEGTLQVVGAYYELASGRVMFSEPVPANPHPNHTAKK